MYSYKDIPDKTVDGIRREVSKGLAVIAVYFQTTFGFPFEVFKDKIDSMDDAKKTLFYMNFRNKHPELFT